MDGSGTTGTVRAYRFGNWVVEPELNRVRHGDTSQQLPPKAMDLLVCLLEQPGTVLSTRDLLERTWPGRVVNENGVPQRIRMIRQCLGDNARSPTYIESVPKRGYRTIAAVEPLHARATREKAALPWLVNGSRHPTLAVLPFTNTGDASADYFCDGLTEDIIADLSLIPGVLVVARQTAFAYKGRIHKIDLAQVGRELNVSHVLEGSVHQLRDRVRVAVQLSDTRSGHHVWAKRYERAWQDQFTLQDEMAGEIVAALDVELVSGERARHQRARIRNPEAGEAFYRGLAHFNRFTPEDNARAKKYFDEVTHLEPESILGYIQLAQNFQQEILMGWSVDTPSAIAQMGALVDRALELDAHDPSALGFAGMHQLLLGNHEDSIRFGERAVNAAPEMDGPYYTLGWYQMFSHMPAEAIENLKRSMNLIPVVTAPRLSVLGTCYRNSDQMDLAVLALEESVRRDPTFTFARAVLASTYAAIGDLGSAQREVREILRIDPAYSVTRYTEPNLYRDKNQKTIWADALRSAGLPD